MLFNAIDAGKFKEMFEKCLAENVLLESETKGAVVAEKASTEEEK